MRWLFLEHKYSRFELYAVTGSAIAMAAGHLWIGTSVLIVCAGINAWIQVKFSRAIPDQK